LGYNKSLGIDIGASSIKIVEVAAAGKKRKLENYLEFFLPYDESFQTFEEESLVLMSDQVAELLDGLLEKTKIRQKKAAFSIPDFSTFITNFSLPPMSEAEIPQAVEFEARHHIPLPLSDVTFDWQLIKERGASAKAKNKVLLVAVPNKVLASYQRLAALCGLETKGIEAEVFGLLRSVVAAEKKHMGLCLVDFGWRSTTVSIVERGVLKMSHSFDFSGTDLTEMIAKRFNLGFAEAERWKRKEGLNSRGDEVSQFLLKRVEPLVSEIKKTMRNFYQLEGKEVEQLVLAGGTALMPGLSEYLEKRIEREVELANPFVDFSYNSLLAERLQEIGPAFAVAVGVGLMGASS